MASLTVSDVFEPRWRILVSTPLIWRYWLVFDLLRANRLVLRVVLGPLLSRPRSLPLHLLILVLVVVTLIRCLPVHLGAVSQATRSLAHVAWIRCGAIAAITTSIIVLRTGHRVRVDAALEILTGASHRLVMHATVPALICRVRPLLLLLCLHGLGLFLLLN